MNTISDLKRCPKCGGPIPAEAPQGLCPKCLMQQACVPTEAGRKGESAQSFPPTHEELAAAFPQLEILELIGQGGMGFVFKARQPKIERLVALKILPQTLAADSAFAERFAREGRVLARLNHPNIVTLHDFGQANGLFYLLMEFVDGVNLRQAMKVGRFTPAQALSVVPKICEALQYAHNEGILHRDIKPENILLDSKGRVKIADFGIAKLVEGGDSVPGQPETAGPAHPANLTETGKVLGTPQYMAPEQLEHPQDVDQRADIYSLGVVFYEMLTGELPIGRFAPPSEKSAVDARVDQVVLRALEKERERRTQTAGEVKTQVEAISSHGTVSLAGKTPPGVAAAPAPAKPDHFWRWFALAVLALMMIPVGIAVLGVLLGIAVPIFSKARDEARQAQESATLNTQPPMAVVLADKTNVLPDQLPPAGGSSTSAPSLALPAPEGQLVLDNVQFDRAHPERGELFWGFKCFVPPGHLASILFVRWTNGVPLVDPGFSGYFKVGQAGGIDIPFCSLACYRILDTESWSGLNQDQRRQTLTAWKYPESSSVTNAVRWDVNIGLGFTSSCWKEMPPYRGVKFQLPQSVRPGHQHIIRLVDFDTPEGNAGPGRSGVELRIFLEPLKSPPIRLAPSEVDHTNYIAGTGIAGSMAEALRAIKEWPTAP